MTRETPIHVPGKPEGQTIHVQDRSGYVYEVKLGPNEGYIVLGSSGLVDY